MNVSPRIAVPVLAAVAVAGSVVLLISLQLQATADRMRRVPGGMDTIDMGTDIEPVGPAEAGGDEILLRMRQGDLAALAGDWKTAQKEYDGAVALGGGIPALRKLAQAQMQRRDLDAVQQTIERLQEEGARDEDLLLLRVIVALRTGARQEARQLLDAAQDSPHRQYGEALLLLVEGQHGPAQEKLAAAMTGWDPAIRAYARALHEAYEEFAAFPQGQPIHLTTLLARALAQVQECELALPMLAPVLQQQEDYRDAWIVQGFCQLTTERTQDALASFERAYSIDPEKPEIQYFLGRAYSALGDHANAVTFLQYAVENGFKPQKEARTRLAGAALDAGNTQLALAQYKELAGQADAEPATVEKAVTLALTLGSKDDALSIAEAAAARWSENARMQEMLGWALQENGRKDDARAALLRAIDLDPGLQSARERLGKL